MRLVSNLLCDTLRETQRDSVHSERFEEALFEAFKALGLKVEYLGGANEPDIILEVSNHKVIVDAKTTKEGVISERYVNFEGMERYKTRYVADDMSIVAPGFSTGNIRDTAQKRGIALIETEAICKLLENHAIYPYKSEQIYNNLFSKNKEIIMPEDISPSTEEEQKLIAIVRQVLTLKNVPSFTIEKLDFLMRAHGLISEHSEIKEALGFLSEPPFNILRHEGEEYIFICDLETTKKKLGLIWQALGLEKPSPLKEGEVTRTSGSQKVTAGEFIHMGGGIFYWEKDDSVRIDLNKSGNEVEKTLNQHRLTIANLSSFYHFLRRKAGLLQKRARG